MTKQNQFEACANARAALINTTCATKKTVHLLQMDIMVLDPWVEAISCF
ncbi:MAG: hypothetical protein AAGB04_04785 [Pseudomonadota bacterium]